MHTRTFLFIFFFTIGLVSCDFRKNNFSYSKGEVFATYYRFQIDSDKDFSKQIDSVFNLIDKAINSYASYSEISKFNKKGSLVNPSPTFVDMLQKAKKYHHLSNY